MKEKNITRMVRWDHWKSAEKFVSGKKSHLFQLKWKKWERERKQHTNTHSTLMMVLYVSVQNRERETDTQKPIETSCKWISDKISWLKSIWIFPSRTKALISLIHRRKKRETSTKSLKIRAAAVKGHWLLFYDIFFSFHFMFIVVDSIIIKMKYR